MIQVKRALQNLFTIDSELSPYISDIRFHLNRYNDKEKRLSQGGKLVDAINGHLYFGFQKNKDGWAFREWLPAADRVWLYGDFNDWNKTAHPLTNIGNGVWEITFDGVDTLRHGQCVKLLVEYNGMIFERIPAYIRRTIMDE